MCRLCRGDCTIGQSQPSLFKRCYRRKPHRASLSHEEAVIQLDMKLQKTQIFQKKKKGNHWNNRTEKLRMLQIKLYFLSFRFWNQRAYSRLAVVISSASPACWICVYFFFFFNSFWWSKSPGKGVHFLDKHQKEAAKHLEHAWWVFKANI